MTPHERKQARETAFRLERLAEDLETEARGYPTCAPEREHLEILARDARRRVRAIGNARGARP